jgi:hypothetical protein
MGIVLTRASSTWRGRPWLIELTNVEFLVGDMRESYFVNRFHGAVSLHQL